MPPVRRCPNCGGTTHETCSLPAPRLCTRCRRPGHRSDTCRDGLVPAAPPTVDVREHMALVETVARSMHRRLPPGVPVDDLISAGHMGLVDAAQKFDPTRGVTFAQYAERRIRGAILDDLRERDSMSRDMRTLQKLIRKATAGLEQKLGRAANEHEVAEALGLSVEKFRHSVQNLAGSNVIGIDDAAENLMDHTADPSAADPFELAARHEEAECLERVIAALPAQMRTVLGLYYTEDLTGREIADIMGLTESRICQIRKDAIARLRDACGGHGGGLREPVPEEPAVEDDPPPELCSRCQEPGHGARNCPLRTRAAYKTKLGLRHETEGAQEMRRALRAANDVDEGAAWAPPARPRTRGDCADQPRPCVWVSCRHNLYLEVTAAGTLTKNFPELEPDQMRESCSLDVADRGSHVLMAVGEVLRLTRERIRQIEMIAIQKAGRAAAKMGIEVPADRFHSPLGEAMLR